MENKNLYEDATANLAPGLLNNAEVIKNRIIYSSNISRTSKEKSAFGLMELDRNLFDMPVETPKKSGRKSGSTQDKAKKHESKPQKNSSEDSGFFMGNIQDLGSSDDMFRMGDSINKEVFEDIGDIGGVGDIGDIGKVGDIDNIGKYLSFNLDDMD